MKKLGHRGPILTVGLTGSVASGKTTTLNEFKKQGWKVISADEIVSEIYRELGLSKDQLRKEIGTSAAKLKRFEKWVHPKVAKKIRDWMKKQNKWVMVEVPLLFEANFQKYFSQVVFVFATRADREARAMKRGMNRRLFQFLDSKQWTPVEKVGQADFILHNKSKKSLQLQVKALSEFLKECAKMKGAQKNKA